MIDFSLTEEQELLLESVKEFCERNVTEAKIQEWIANHRVPDEYNKAYLDAGFGFFGIPEEYGGVEIDIVTQALFYAEFTRRVGACFPNNLLFLYDILEFGTPEMIKQFMDKYMKTGSCSINLAVSEPGGASDNMSMTTTTKTVDGKIVLNGQKTFCSGARNSDYLIILAKDEDPSRENKNISMWLVPTNLPGMKLVNVEEIGMKLNPFSDLYLDNVVIDESMLLGKRGKGFLQLMKNFEMERILVAAQSWGFAMAAMDDAAAYTSQRVVFGQPIGNYQLIQKKLVDMQVRIDNIRNYILETAWKLQQGKSIQTECSLIKYYCCRAAHEVCDDAMEIFGGIGFTTDSRVSRLWAESRGNCIAGGTEEIMIYIAGRQLVKKYKK